MKSILTFVLIIGLFAGNMNAQTKEWTLLVYMVGSDIVDDGLEDLGEMQAAGNTDNINIVAMLGGAQRDGWWTPNTSIFVDGEEIPQSFVPSIPNMANSTNITEFINWGVSNFPAEKYMLLFYNHGMDIRGFGWDNTIDRSSTVGDIQTGIADSDFIMDNNKFEVIGFDACLMASFEVQSALRDFGKYYIGSEETEPGHAWNWTPVITAMNTQSGLDGAGLGRIVVDTYLQHAKDFGTEHVTLSVTDLSKITALETALETLLSSLDDDIYLSNFIQARAMAEEYHKVISQPEYSEDMVDIGDLVKHLRDLEPGLTSLIDDVLDKIDDAVVYERSDATRPKATGLTMYVPLNVLVEEGEADYLIDEVYSPIDFSETIKDFIVNQYYPYALSDDDPISGSIDNSFGLTTPGGTPKSFAQYTAIRIDSGSDDLHQVQVILLEEITDIPNEYLVLGSTYPDTSVANPDGSTTFAYEWDEEWLSLNGFPAYVADIQYFEVEDENGDFSHGFTRIHIPAILNPGTENEKNIMFSYKFDDDFNHELEGILRESYGEQVMIPPKERIDLQPGDQVQLLYEIFDTETHEAFFTATADAIINIANGNEDLTLDHSLLEPGRYHLGFVLMDHSHNDTIIYDPRVYEILTVDVDDALSDNISVNLSPNPAAGLLRVDFNKVVLQGGVDLLDSRGKLLLSRNISGRSTARIDMKDLPGGIYFVKLRIGKYTVTRKIVKP